jgi:uncharacterized protein DUF6644
MSLLAICQWIQDTSVGTALRESTYMFPVVEGSHLLGLGISVGTIMVSDLRLMGVILKKERASAVMGSLLPWSISGFVFMMITGVFLFWCEAVKAYNSTWFRFKVLFLILAFANIVIFHTTSWLRMDEWDLDPVPPRGARLAGLLSLILWTLVITAGRTTAYNF